MKLNFSFFHSNSLSLEAYKHDFIIPFQSRNFNEITKRAEIFSALPENTLLVSHIKPVFQTFHIYLTGLFQSWQYIIGVVSDHGNPVIRSHTHMNQRLLHLSQAFQRPSAGTARAGNQHTALLRQIMIVCGLTSA